MIIQYILYFICQKLYWTVSGQLFNIGYIGQFQNEATGTLRTRYRRTKAVSMYLIKISSILLHLWKILICFRKGWFFIVNNIINIGWLTVQYRLYWTQISYIGLGCASSNIAFVVQYNLYWTVDHPILYNIYIYVLIKFLPYSGATAQTRSAAMGCIGELRAGSRPAGYERFGTGNVAPLAVLVPIPKPATHSKGASNQHPHCTVYIWMYHLGSH